MQNLELKARDPDPPATLAAALAAGAEDHGTLVQRDTYYAARTGRLKLREERPGAAELIAYARADEARARVSEYVLTAVPDPAALHAVLERALGVEAVVEKRRRLLILGRVRIHLDDVAGLGTFVELESVVPDGGDPAADEAAIAALRAQLGMSDDRILATGYAQLLRRDQPGGAMHR